MTACLGKDGFQSALAKDEKDTARASVALGFSFPCSKMSIICLIGVMPQIGSFEKGKLYAIAPTNLLSMKTGEPDMPAKTPVRSTFGPLSLAMIVDCRGPVKPLSTPRISRLNSCGSVPEKTVRATPFIPGFRSSSAKSAEPSLFVEEAWIFTWPTAIDEKVNRRNSPTIGRICILGNFIIQLPLFEGHPSVGYQTRQL